MNNEAFFDILGELDDDIISDAAQITVSASPKKKRLKSLIMIAAAVTIFIISGFIITESIKTGNMGLYEITAESTSDRSGQSLSAEEPSVTAKETTLPDTGTSGSFTDVTEEQTTRTPETTEAPSGAQQTTQEEQTTDEGTVTAPYADPDEPSENLTAPPQGDTTEETVASEPSSDPSTTEPLCGEVPPDVTQPLFIEVPAAAFLEALPRDSFDTDKFVKSEAVSGLIIEDIYGTKIIPDYIPTFSTSGPSVDSIPSDSIKNGEYTVYFTADSLEVYSSQEFRFLTRSGILTVKAATEPFPLYEEEKINTDSRFLINGIPVLLLAGRLSGRNTVLDAQFEKDGVYFRVLLKGSNLIEEEFIMILESLI